MESNESKYNPDDLVREVVRENFRNDYRGWPIFLFDREDTQILKKKQETETLRAIYTEGCEGWFSTPYNLYGDAENPYHRLAYEAGWQAMNISGRKKGIKR